MCLYTFPTEFCGDKHTFPTEFCALSKFLANVCYIILHLNCYYEGKTY